MTFATGDLVQPFLEMEPSLGDEEACKAVILCLEGEESARLQKEILITF